MDYDGLRGDMVQMLGGGRVRTDTRSFQNDMRNFKTKDDVLTLLIHLGYLAYDAETEEVFIPNREIIREFETAMNVSGWDEVMGVLKASEQVLRKKRSKSCAHGLTWTLRRPAIGMTAINSGNTVISTIPSPWWKPAGDADSVAAGLDRAHTEVASILTYNDESSLGTAISLAYYSARKDYRLIRELPTGKGFADVAFLPLRHTGKPALVVELKYDKSVNSALQQIKDRHYTQALEGDRKSVV